MQKSLCQSSPKTWGKDKCLKWSDIDANTLQTAVLERCCSLQHGCARLLPSNPWSDPACAMFNALEHVCWKDHNPIPTFCLTFHCLKDMLVLCVALFQTNNKSSLTPKWFFYSPCKRIWMRVEVHSSGRNVFHFPEKGDQIVWVSQQQIEVLSAKR